VCEKVVINNGAAGMPNFTNTNYGIITRIATTATATTATTDADADAVYGVTVSGVRCEAVPVRFDVLQWRKRFLSCWPTASAANDSYWHRIAHGVDGYTIDNAARTTTTTTSADAVGRM